MKCLLRGVTTFYDSLGRLTSATEKAGATTTASWAFGYDADGNRTTQTRAGSTGAAAGTTTYGYNAADELTSATGSTATWTYDGNGDQTKNGLTGQTQTINDRLAATAIGTTGYSSFAQGNTVALSRGSTNFGSSALGTSGETTASAATLFVRDPDGAPVATKTPTGMYFYVRDSIGSVVGLLDSSGSFSGGYSYSPYGETRSATNSSVISANPIRYIGGYSDSPSALYRFGARFYDSSLGRFTQQDPSGQEPNSYAHASGDPINRVDLTGLLSKTQREVIGTVAAAAVGVAVTALVCSVTAGLGCLVGGALFGATAAGATKGFSDGVLAGKSARKTFKSTLNGAAYGAIGGGIVALGFILVA